MSQTITPVIHAQGFSATPAIRTHLINRFTQALLKFNDRILQVDIFMKDLNGTGKGGEDQSVLVSVSLRGLPRVVTETVSHDLYRSLSIASRRTGRAVRRSVRRHDRINRRAIAQAYFSDSSEAEPA